ncbi:MAG TPA: DUF885 family protein, partial [Gemmatimonadaceae bacterium]
MSASLTDVFEGYLDLRYRIDPVEGTRAGRRELDGMYAAYDAASVRAHTVALRSYAGALEAASTETLDDEIDRTAALHDARHALLMFEHERPFSRDPSFLLIRALDGLHRLLADADAEPTRRAVSLAGRLSALPAFLATAATAASHPLRPLIATAASMLPGALALLDNDLDDALTPAVVDPAARAALRSAARNGMVGYSDALSLMEERARDDVAIGRELFEHKLHTAHMIQDGAAQLLRWAEAAHAEARADVEAAASVLEPGGVDWRTIVADLDRRAASDRSTSTLKAYGEALDAARRFASEHGIVAGGDPPVRIVPTPEYRRALVPFAEYEASGPFVAERIGTLYVTGPGGSGAEGTVVHEIVPGHHHQVMLANQLPQLIRRVVVSAAAREGWACYSELVMAEAGFFISPAARLLHARDVLWRAVRAIVDVSLHTMGMV